MGEEEQICRISGETNHLSGVSLSELGAKSSGRGRENRSARERQKPREMNLARIMLPTRIKAPNFGPQQPPVYLFAAALAPAQHLILMRADWREVVETPTRKEGVCLPQPHLIDLWALSLSFFFIHPFVCLFVCSFYSCSPSVCWQW